MWNSSRPAYDSPSWAEEGAWGNEDTKFNLIVLFLQFAWYLKNACLQYPAWGPAGVEDAVLVEGTK